MVSIPHLTNSGVVGNSQIKRLLQRSLLRTRSRIELSFLQAGSFALLNFLLFIEKKASSSAVLMRYFKLFTEHRFTLAAFFSVATLIFHYKTVTMSRTEVRCRILVGDNIAGIRVRHATECFLLLGICYAFFTLLCLILKFEAIENLYLCGLLASYILFSTVFMRAQ